MFIGVIKTGGTRIPWGDRGGGNYSAIIGLIKGRVGGHRGSLLEFSVDTIISETQLLRHLLVGKVTRMGSYPMSTLSNYTL